MSEPDRDVALPPSPHNPYAAPLASAPLRQRLFPSPALCALVGMYLVVALGTLALAVGANSILAVGAVLFPLPAVAIQVWWFRNQWKRLPARLQMVKNQGVTPWQAAGRCLIPIYNFYWMLVVNAALCDGINAMLTKKGRPTQAPIWLGTVAPLVTIAVNVLSKVTRGPVMFLGIALLAVLWSAFAIRVEIAFDEAKRVRNT